MTNQAETVKTIKVYPYITGVELLDDKTVYCVDWVNPVSVKAKECINYHVECYGKDWKTDFTDTGYALTKEETLEEAKHLVCKGYGTHSGRKIWQLPQNLRNQISKLLKPVEVEIKLSIVKKTNSPSMEM